MDHPHICRLFETYQRGTLMYYVMELCEGKAALMKHCLPEQVDVHASWR